jgi:hypothetical protein
MVRLLCDETGKVTGMPLSLLPTGAEVFEIVSEDVDLASGTAQSLSLELESPAPIVAGEWILAYGGDSIPAIPANEATAYAIETELNRLASIISAGGVTVEDSEGRMVVLFDSAGARTGITVNHSTLGTLARAVELVAGGASQRASFSLDLTVQTLAKSATATALSSASVTVANVATGGVSTRQRDTITISRAPDRGKFQIRTASDTATAWMSADVSGYQIQAELDDIEPDEFIVSAEEMGTSVVFDICRREVGANTAITVSNTFLGPAGVSISLDLADIPKLVEAAGIKLPRAARITYIYSGEAIFSELLQISPMTYGQAQPI